MKKDIPKMAKMNMTRKRRRQILNSAGRDMAKQITMFGFLWHLSRVGELYPQWQLGLLERSTYLAIMSLDIIPRNELIM